MFWIMQKTKKALKTEICESCNLQVCMLELFAKMSDFSSALASGRFNCFILIRTILCYGAAFLEKDCLIRLAKEKEG